MNGLRTDSYQQPGRSLGILESSFDTWNQYRQGMRSPVPPEVRRQLDRQAVRADDVRDEAFREVIRTVPPGRVSTYGKVAAAAGYPLYHRAVARLLRTATHDGLPWQRIVGAGGLIKLRGDAALTQRTHLEREGVRFTGNRIDMATYEHPLKPWER